MSLEYSHRKTRLITIKQLNNNIITYDSRLDLVSNNKFFSNC